MNKANGRIVKKQEKEKVINIRNLNGVLQWRFGDTEDWKNLVNTNEMVGPQGLKGEKGDKGDRGGKGDKGLDGKNGVDGKNGKDGTDGKDGQEIILRKSATHIQWKRIDQDTWKDLIALEELRGPEGHTRIYGGGGGNNQGGGTGDGVVISVVAGNNIDVDATDPANPVVSVESLLTADITDLTATATELNYTDGVTSSIQTQLGNKQPLDSDLTALAAAGNSTVLANTTASFLTADETKLDGIEAGADVTDATNVAAAGAFMKSVDDTDDITVGATNKFATAAEKTKLGHITVTQAVDLDTMESDIANKQPLDADLTAIAGLDSSTSGAIASDGAGWIKKTYAQFKTALGLVKGDVGLGNVDNTSDVNKPVSTAQQTALDLKQNLTEKDQALGYVGLDASSKINPAQLPALAITETFVVASQAAMLALTAQTGDVAVRTDQNKSYILTAEPASTLGNWQELLTPTGAVTSVFGRSGVVTAQNGDYTAVQVTNVPAGSIGAVTVQAAIDELDSEKQPIDSDLTAIAALTPSNDDVIQRKAGVWTNRTIAQLLADMALGSLYQPLDADLTTIAGLTATTDNFIVSVSSAWASRTPAQVKTTLSLNNVDNTSDATKNSATATLTNKRITPRVGTTTSSATPTINTDNVDMYGLTAQTVDITSFTTNLSGTPTDGQKLWIYVVGTAACAIAWGSSFEAGPVALPSTTVTTQRLDVGFVWNAVSNKWRCIASGSA